MPTYEYACQDCGEHLEVVQSFRDDPLETCPNCEGELRKVFSPAGIIFKGSGWHIKDYGTGVANSKTAEPPPAKAEGAGSDGDGTGQDAGGTGTGTGAAERSA